MKSLGDVLSPNDPELVEKTLARIDEQDQWNDLFSTKLIELLDGLDGFKADARKRMLRIEEINEAAETRNREAVQEYIAASKSAVRASRIAVLATGASWVAVVVFVMFPKVSLAPAVGIAALVVICIAVAVLFWRLR